MPRIALEDRCDAPPGASRAAWRDAPRSRPVLAGRNGAVEHQFDDPPRCLDRVLARAAAGWISLEVPPNLADDATMTVAEAVRLHARAERRLTAATVLSAALFGRLRSRGEAEFADQSLSAMRKQLGGHAEIAAATGYERVTRQAGICGCLIRSQRECR